MQVHSSWSGRSRNDYLWWRMMCGCRYFVRQYMCRALQDCVPSLQRVCHLSSPTCLVQSYQNEIVKQINEVWSQWYPSEFLPPYSDERYSLIEFSCKRDPISAPLLVVLPTMPHQVVASLTVPPLIPAAHLVARPTQMPKCIIYVCNMCKLRTSLTAIIRGLCLCDRFAIDFVAAKMWRHLYLLARILYVCCSHQFVSLFKYIFSYCNGIITGWQFAISFIQMSWTFFATPCIDDLQLWCTASAGNVTSLYFYLSF